MLALLMFRHLCAAATDELDSFDRDQRSSWKQKTSIHDSYNTDRAKGLAFGCDTTAFKLLADVDMICPLQKGLGGAEKVDPLP